MDLSIRRILHATPVRSLQDDPIITRKRVQAPTEKELWKQDIEKSSRGL